MKNNFLYGNTLPRGASVFLKTVVLIVLFITQLAAQNSDKNHALPLKSGKKIMQENIQNIGFAKNTLTQQLFEGKSYVLLQFYQMPDVQMHEKIKELGIELTQYIAANTYRAAIPEGISTSSLAKINVRAIDVMTSVEKIEPFLLRTPLPRHVEVVSGKMDIRLVLEAISIESVIKALQSFEIEYLDKEVRYRKYLPIRINQVDIESVAAMPFVSYILPAPTEPRPLGSNIESPSASRSGVIRAEYIRNTYELDGKGVVAGIFESTSNIYAINHIDLRGNTNPITLLDQVAPCYGNTTEACCDNMDGHGEAVSSMAGGQGILRPGFKGVAPEISMLYLDAGSIPSALSNYSSSGIPALDKMVLTNQSYTGGNGSVVDEQLLDYPETMQIAAVGNSGVECTIEDPDNELGCPTNPNDPDPPIAKYYSVGGYDCCDGGYGNEITTNMSGKNLVTVGAIDMYGRIIDGRKKGSSKGPTWDGRIKPEVVAIGGGTHDDSGLSPMGSAYAAAVTIMADDNDIVTGCVPNTYGGLAFGTSYAAPQAVGGLALLYEYYREHLPTDPMNLPVINTHPNPNGALIKAIVCNTADDLGNPGPDYVYGFGKINLRKAINTLENGWYLSDEFSQGSTYADTRTYEIVVPDDKSYYQLKIMLYWPDDYTYVGSDYSSCQLVNNLDLLVNDNIYPLRPNPDLGMHTLPATSPPNNCLIPDDCTDCNNIEQVVIEVDGLLVSGATYEVDVKPKYISGSDQPYYLTWEFIEPDVKIISPFPDEVITNGGVSNYYVEWDYDGPDDNDFLITITDDGGYEETATVSGDLRMYKWAKCDQLNMNSSNVTVRVDRKNTNYSDETTFSVYNGVRHNSLAISHYCSNQACLTWDIECSADGNTTDGTPPAFFTVYRYVEEYDDNGNITDNDMQFVLTTSDYSAVVDFEGGKEEEWYAVSTTYYDANSEEYIETTRCNAKRFEVPKITNCSGNEVCVAGNNCPDGVPGTSCNDDDPCTTNDVYDADCNCAGTPIDTGGDTYPGGCSDCPINIVIEDSDVPGIYKADNFIKTDQYASVSVDPEEQLTLRAGKFIDLYPGFSADAGSVYSLHAEIEDCEPLLPVERRSDGEAASKPNSLTVKHFPNPFREEVSLELQLNFDAEIAVTITDVNGRIVHQVQVGYLNQGIQTINIPTQKWADGVYFYRVSAKAENTNILKYANGVLAKM